jgi:hypothetical protein
VLLAAAAQVSTTKKAITTAKLLFMPFVFSRSLWSDTFTDNQ